VSHPYKSIDKIYRKQWANDIVQLLSGQRWCYKHNSSVQQGHNCADTRIWTPRNSASRPQPPFRPTCLLWFSQLRHSVSRHNIKWCAAVRQ